MCHENTSHTITHTPDHHTHTHTHTQHHHHQPVMLTHGMIRCIYSCSFLHTLVLPSAWNSRNRDSSDQAMFFQSSSVHCFHSFANCNCRFLFVAERSETPSSRRLPFPIRVKVRWVVHCFMGLSAPMLSETVTWLTVARLLLCTIHVSLLGVLSSMTHFWPLACRCLDVLWVVDHYWYTQENVDC